MRYGEAKKIRVGDIILIRARGYEAATVLTTICDPEQKKVCFRCTEGIFDHRDVVPDLGMDTLAQLFLKDPRTRVFVNYNNELGEWRYAVEVAGSDSFWLESFETEKEAEDYIAEHGLKKIAKA